MVQVFIQEAEWYLVILHLRLVSTPLLKNLLSNRVILGMFFTDAIRLLLESHGRRGRSDHS